MTGRKGRAGRETCIPSPRLGPGLGLHPASPLPLQARAQPPLTPPPSPSPSCSPPSLVLCLLPSLLAVLGRVWDLTLCDKVSPSGITRKFLVSAVSPRLSWRCHTSWTPRVSRIYSKSQWACPHETLTLQ